MADSVFPNLSEYNLCVCVCAQVEVIKKAYQQESECEQVEVEVSPREVGHNIYILAQQVTKYKPLIGCWDPSVLCYWLTLSENDVCLFVCLQLARHNKVLQNLLKPQKKSKEGEEGISSMVNSPSNQ